MLKLLNTDYTQTNHHLFSPFLAPFVLLFTGDANFYHFSYSALFCRVFVLLFTTDGNFCLFISHSCIQPLFGPFCATFQRMATSVISLLIFSPFLAPFVLLFEGTATSFISSPIHVFSPFLQGFVVFFYNGCQLLSISILP